MKTDEYKTIDKISEGFYSESRSKFHSFAIPVHSQEEMKERLKEYQNKFYDARHVCYAFMIGPAREDYRSNDDGEPSGTAGKPILGQINSNELTDIMIIVVRYFGGKKLGTSGLINAYRTAAADALENADFKIKTIDEDINIYFDYLNMHEVMHVIKDEEPQIIEQVFEMSCYMKLRQRLLLSARLRERLEDLRCVKFENKDKIQES